MSPRATVWFGLATTVFLTVLGFLLIAERRTGLGAILLALAGLRGGLVIRHWSSLTPRDRPPPA